MKRTMLAAVAAAGLISGSVALAAPAFAQNPPPVTISGEATVPTSITLALSATSFGITAPAGVTTTVFGSDAASIQATVATNDANGYQLMQALTAPGFTDGVGDTIAGTDISALSQSAPGTDAGYLPFDDSGGAVRTASSTHVSAPAGDVYALNYQFSVPANQVGANYSGTVTVSVLAS